MSFCKNLPVGSSNVSSWITFGGQKSCSDRSDQEGETAGILSPDSLGCLWNLSRGSQCLRTISHQDWETSGDLPSALHKSGWNGVLTGPSTVLLPRTVHRHSPAHGHGPAPQQLFPSAWSCPSTWSWCSRERLVPTRSWVCTLTQKPRGRGILSPALGLEHS